MILDLFAGPGGWDQGAAMLGATDTLGIEWDRAACDTAIAAGHPRIWADVAQLPTNAVLGYGPVDGLIASPPCQAWSMAGKRKGEHDRASCHALADRMATGDDSTDWTSWEDDRSSLVCQPVRWVRDLRPPWVALEEVPAVASLWEHFARIFRSWGYGVWTGDVNSADYGVPQTRERRILLARADGPVTPPESTHAAIETGGDLFGGLGRKRWVSMAQALGWGILDRPSTTVMARNGDERGGAGGPRPLDGGSGARETYRRAQVEGRWLRMGNQPGACVRHIDEHAPTVLFGNRMNAVTWHAEEPPSRAEREAPALIRTQNFTATTHRGQRGQRYERSTELPSPTLTGQSRLAEWVYDRPATTVQGDPRIGRPGHKDRAVGGESQFALDSVPVSVEEAGILQSFPADYPWRGSRTKQYQQVGNAIPPLLAAHLLSVLGVGALAVSP